MADKNLKDRSDEMEHDLQRLGDHIGEAEQKLEARRKDADPDAVAAGGEDGYQPDAGSAEEVAAEVEGEQTGGDAEEAPAS
jgi:hypothetical protein